MKTKTTKKKNKLVSAFRASHKQDVEESNLALTENGALTFKSTLSPVLDLFAMGGALRQREESEVVDLFKKAFLADASLALKTIFYLRDVRGGQGERRTFRVALKWLAENHPYVARKMLVHIPEYGRFDDLLTFLETPVEDEVVKIIRNGLRQDLQGLKDSKVSLLAKWLPSENASSDVTKKQARLLIHKLGVTPKYYRQTLSKLRRQINIVESQMCSQEWSGINYEHVPSRASLIYRKAFGRHDGTRYSKYLSDVMGGKKEIKAGTLFPHELLNALWYGGGMNATINAQWKSLPDYLAGSKASAIVVTDVSGSMNGLPLTISVGLALYFSERSRGPFRDHFITFSAQPEIQLVRGKTLEERAASVQRSNWDMNTDLQAVFDTVLDMAVENKVPQKDLPNTIFIVSDMEFDCTGGYTNLESIREKYKAAGYKAPKLVFWNVNSHQNNVAALATDQDVALISGCSPSIVKTVLSLSDLTPWGIFQRAVVTDRYSAIKG